MTDEDLIAEYENDLNGLTLEHIEKLIQETQYQIDDIEDDLEDLFDSINKFKSELEMLEQEYDFQGSKLDEEMSWLEALCAKARIMKKRMVLYDFHK